MPNPFRMGYRGPCAWEGCRSKGWQEDEDGEWWCRRHDPFLKDGREAVRQRRHAARITARELE